MIMNDYDWSLEDICQQPPATRPSWFLLFFSYEQFKAWKIRLTFADDVPSQLLAPMKPWSDAENGRLESHSELEVSENTVGISSNNYFSKENDENPMDI